ncbi:MAG TPA: lytic transglycosylase domain-containing protein [Vicinamibacterales bacterium]|nr:lytic transglycosylase domain-containing protein [Vicinamibacterales bacterium]
MSAAPIPAVVGVLVAAMAALVPSTASADLVRLTNGRVIKVDLCRFEGDQAILSMPGGGEVRTPRSLIAELLPDEESEAADEAVELRARSASARGPTLASRAIVGLINDLAGRHGVDTELAHAVVRAESNYNPLAVSPKGAMGLMQLMPATAAQYGVTDPFDPAQNLDAGLRHLRRLLERYDRRHALAAYNAGEGAVNRYGGVPPYRETQAYVRRILADVDR